MCGRFTLHHATEEVTARFGAQRTLFESEARYNVAPGTDIAAVTLDVQGRKLEGLRWGLVPFWAREASIGNKMINARVETLTEKASFKHALTRRRCLIPADGFFEWKESRADTSKKATKQPMHIRFKSRELFAFAGLWEEWRDKTIPNAPVLKSCTIITGPPNRLLATLHHRMAVILRPEDEARWLDPNLQEPDEILSLLGVFPDEEMEAFEVSTRLNAPAYDAPDLIEPLALTGNAPIAPPPEASEAQRSLF
jgi:putative SOS response-associated peptidase YedK